MNPNPEARSIKFLIMVVFLQVRFYLLAFLWLAAPSFVFFGLIYPDE